jgi:hypothetical protein
MFICLPHLPIKGVLKMKKFEYYVVLLMTYVLLFGGIFLSGWMAGTDWTDYSFKLTWEMVNKEAIKDIFMIEK